MSYGGTFPVDKNKTPLPSPEVQIAIRAKKECKSPQKCRYIKSVLSKSPRKGVNQKEEKSRKLHFSAKPSLSESVDYTAGDTFVKDSHKTQRYPLEQTTLCKNCNKKIKRRDTGRSAKINAENCQSFVFQMKEYHVKDRKAKNDKNQYTILVQIQKVTIQKLWKQKVYISAAVILHHQPTINQN